MRLSERTQGQKECRSSCPAISNRKGRRGRGLAIGGAVARDGRSDKQSLCLVRRPKVLVLRSSMAAIFLSFFVLESPFNGLLNDCTLSNWHNALVEVNGGGPGPTCMGMSLFALEDCNPALRCSGPSGTLSASNRYRISATTASSRALVCVHDARSERCMPLNDGSCSTLARERQLGVQA